MNWFVRRERLKTALGSHPLNALSISQRQLAISEYVQTAGTAGYSYPDPGMTKCLS